MVFKRISNTGRLYYYARRNVFIVSFTFVLDITQHRPTEQFETISIIAIL